jgi:hypothetical protein
VIDKTILKSLGFTEFTHLRKSERDGKERMICTTLYCNTFLTIFLLKQNDNWIIEKLVFHDESSAKNELSKDMNVEELIAKVFKK